MSRKEKKETAGKKTGKAAVLIILSALLIAGVAAAVFFSPGTVKMQVGTNVFTLEVAKDSDARSKGLSNRDSLDEDAGMLFIYQEPTKVNYWMKNTSIPLTVAYLNNDGTILEMHDLTPYSERPVPSKTAVTYVLELKQGAFQRSGAKVGDKITRVSWLNKHSVPF